MFDQVPGTEGALIPGTGVGYMPQDLCLFPEFTIHETLELFGKIFGIPKDDLQSKCTRRRSGFGRIVLQMLEKEGNQFT